MPVKVKMKKKM